MLRFGPPSNGLQKTQRHLRAGSGVLLAIACGPEHSPVTPWEYGGGERPILSWPVIDEEGNVFVFVGSDAQRESPASMSYEAQAIDLVSLDPSGAERWSYRMHGPSIVTEAYVRPSVRDGDVWSYSYSGGLARISADGHLRWQTDIPPLFGGVPPFSWNDSSFIALGQDGTSYILPWLPQAPQEQQELWAIDRDGDMLWQLAPNRPGATNYDAIHPDQTQAPLIIPDGSVIVGCTTCVEGQAGLARVAPATGEASLLYTIEWGHRALTFGDLRWDGTQIWHEFDDSWWELRASLLDGTAEVPEYSMALATATGEVWVEEWQTDTKQFTLHWGQDKSTVDLSGLFSDEPAGLQIQVLVATEPAAALVLLDGSKGNMLVLVDTAGQLLWHRADIFVNTTPVPIITGGRILYIDGETRRLIAEEVPVERVADGPWPMLGGNPQNTRSAESPSSAP